MESKNTYLLQDTESFMRGELDNVTVSEGRILLDMVQGAYVPYGCYTSPAIPMPSFDLLRVSWNAVSPAGTAVEAQARVMVDGNWSGWFSFGKWSPYMRRASAKPVCRGPITVKNDLLALDSKHATQAQMRIYLYTKEDKSTPAVTLLGVSVRSATVIPASGRPIHAQLHTMPYSLARRLCLEAATMSTAICIASLTNRWGADLLPEEFALLMQDYAMPAGSINFSFAAASAGCHGFPSWAAWTDLAMLRREVRSGYGVIVALRSTQTQLQEGLPPLRAVTVRGFDTDNDIPCVLLSDPFAAGADFEVEIRMALDDFLVAWNNLAIFVHKAVRRSDPGCPQREFVPMRHTADEPQGIYRFYRNGKAALLPEEFCGSAAAPCGMLAWSIPDERPHATTAHRCFHYCHPEEGGIRLERTAGEFVKYTVYAIDYTGTMVVSDVLL